MNWKSVNPVRLLYLKIRNTIMARGGLQPAGTHWYSRAGHVYRDTDAKLWAPNLAQGLHEVLVQYWDQHGLGTKCLLVSENRPTREILARRHLGVAFTTSDLFPEIAGIQEGEGPDFRWDICFPPPEAMRVGYDSIICHALLEHVIAPTEAVGHLVGLLAPGGRLYAMTHTPSFFRHRFPRDYCRFHHDWFEDLPEHLLRAVGVGVTLEEMFSREGVVCVMYRRADAG